MVYYRHYCPYCNHVTGLSLRGYGVRLGSGSQTCSSCERTFKDGTKEWPELTPQEKREFLWKDQWILASMWVIFLAIGAYKRGFSNLMFLVATAPFFAFFLLSMTIRGFQILSSKQRAK